MVEFELAASDFSLEFIIFDADGLEWCRIFLIRKNKKEELGNNSKEVVFKRLLPILSPETFPPTPTKLHDENLYTCFMMLYTQETSAYARQTDSGLELQFLNNLGKTIATFNLSFKKCRAWKSQLHEFI